MKKCAVIIGSGIVGLALAKALSEKKWSVVIIEKSNIAQGASIRNFGMIWPVGQPLGNLYDRAMRSREIWLDLSRKAGFWSEETGSLHLAYTELENQIIKEYVEKVQSQKSAIHLSPGQIHKKSPAAVSKGLKGGLFSQEEVLVNPREAIQKMTEFFENHLGIQFIKGIAASNIRGNNIVIGRKTLQADKIFVCSGSDFETLFPEEFQNHPITKCKLQMMRLSRQPNNWRIGPPLCSGLSFIHYKAFDIASSTKILRQYFQEHFPELIKFGIHVMVSQNGAGHLTIGDSHEYGKDPDPFNQQQINDIIIQYLKTFANFKSWKIESYWNGIYAKMTNGDSELVLDIDENTTIVNGLGGAGMTLAFGLAEEVVHLL
ncbi:TIGR03364 family FAD-dependent oxidoreductase [Membranihabitans maritimus]|uniref:TIGR03364 family FAD-dependent oxidoreductase n=1 Tax=Membranihabitans maritimus TaxID=2904244 RepID=UPI001F007F5C|nr:TIGR03364 family FAD-dependent oxidoreductase [Membranihabitans maritimus]